MLGSDQLSRGCITSMAPGRRRRPRDPIQLGKLIVNIASGQVELLSLCL